MYTYHIPGSVHEKPEKFSKSEPISVGNKFRRVDYSLTFGVDERRTERPVEDPGLEGDVRVLLGVMPDAEPDCDVKSPSPAASHTEGGP